MLNIIEQKLINMPMLDESNFVLKGHCNIVKRYRHNKIEVLEKINTNYNSIDNPNLNVTI